MSKEVGTPRYLSLVVSLKKISDEAVHKELGDRMERVATNASSLEAEQDSGSGPRCQDTILGDVDAQTRFEITSKQSNDPPLSKGYTLGSGEDSMKLFELMELCTELSYKNRKSVLVSQKELTDNVSIQTERELVRIKFDDENCFLDEIWVITGILKLMLLSIHFLLLVYINTAKLMLGSVNTVRHMLMLLVQVPAAEEDEEDEEEDEHLAPADPSAILTGDPLYTISSCFLRPNPVQYGCLFNTILHDHHLPRTRGKILAGLTLSDCPELKNQNHENGGTGARGVVHALGGGETNQDHNDMEEDINA
ncbi:hypothetical protein Tco_0680827 [Tanacetum coccineum]|uniref:Uncharacterized protein n=1 Tax=Tanacetum coccineum TaxID=301880 RepID=A0ABQ4XMT2_9ASTR